MELVPRPVVKWSIVVFRQILAISSRSGIRSFSGPSHDRNIFPFGVGLGPDGC